LTLTRRASRLSCRELASSAANRASILRKELSKRSYRAVPDRDLQQEPARNPPLASTASSRPPSNLHSKRHFRQTTPIILVNSAEPPNSSFDISRGFELDPATGFQYAQSLTPAAPFQQLGAEPFVDQGFGPPTSSSSSDHLGFTDPSVLSPLQMPPKQTNVHAELVMHYFNNVRRVQPFFAGEALTDVTYSAVVEEPRGAVTLAICALADLHLKQMRVSQGLEVVNQNLENSSTTAGGQTTTLTLPCISSACRSCRGETATGRRPSTSSANGSSKRTCTTLRIRGWLSSA